MKVLLHPAAAFELQDAVEYYAAIDLELGHRFYTEIERLINEVISHPKLFRQFDPPLRRHFSVRFPYGLIYLEQPDCLWVVAIMHLKRRPNYWKARVRERSV